MGICPPAKPRQGHVIKLLTNERECCRSQMRTNVDDSQILHNTQKSMVKLEREIENTLILALKR